MSTDLSVVIPVYKSRTILPVLVSQIIESCKDLGSLQIILVNDGCPDGSWQVIEEQKKQHPEVIKGINLMKNFGQMNALMAGLHHAKGDYVVIMDDDLQHSPADIPGMYALCREGHDIVYADFELDHEVLWKRLGSAFNNKTAEILFNKPKGLYLSPFKIFRKELLPSILQYTGPYPYVDGLLIRTSDKISTFKTTHMPRHEGQGNFNMARSFFLWLNVATSFSIIPLRLVGLMGLVVFMVSFCLALFYLVTYLQGNQGPEGWITLIIVTLSLGGIQMVALAVIGEYLGRSFMTQNSSQQFSIREVL